MAYLRTQGGFYPAKSSFLLKSLGFGRIGGMNSSSTTGKSTDSINDRDLLGQIPSCGKEFA